MSSSEGKHMFNSLWLTQNNDKNFRQQKILFAFVCTSVSQDLSPITVASRKYAPPFATLALVQSAGEAYTRDATFSPAITPTTPFDREMSSGSVDADFVLALPFHHGDLTV